MIRLFLAKCFCTAPRQRGLVRDGERACPYCGDAFSSRLEVVEDLAAAVDGLAIQQLLNEPKDQTWLAVL